MKQFHFSQKVRFGHTDPAGIVFYPRYFEMVSDVIEDWFENLDLSFKEMHTGQKFGVPLVHIEADFKNPSRLGDTLDLYLEFTKLGASSLDFKVTGSCKGKDRFKITGTIAYVNLTEIRAARWPDSFREIMKDWVPATGKVTS